MEGYVLPTVSEGHEAELSSPGGGSKRQGLQRDGWDEMRRLLMKTIPSQTSSCSSRIPGLPVLVMSRSRPGRL